MKAKNKKYIALAFRDFLKDRGTYYFETDTSN
jgi:hypothetical protein